MILLNYNEIEKNIKKIMKNSKNIRKKILIIPKNP